MLHNMEDQGLAMPPIRGSEQVHPMSKGMETEKRPTSVPADRIAENEWQSPAGIHPEVTNTALCLRAVRLLESSNSPRVI